MDWSLRGSTPRSGDSFSAVFLLYNFAGSIKSEKFNWSIQTIKKVATSYNTDRTQRGKIKLQKQSIDWLIDFVSVVIISLSRPIDWLITDSFYTEIENPIYLFIFCGKSPYSVPCLLFWAIRPPA